MRALTRVAVRRPRTVLAVWAVVVAVLAVVGADVREALRPTDIIVPGTPTGTWDELREDRFGEDGGVLLRGPAKALDRQGPALARAIARDPRARAVSPWSQAPGTEALRPRPGVALLLADAGPRERASPQLARLERLVEERVRPPVRGWVIGQAPVAEALNEELVKSAEQAERLSLPVLLAVLLLVFRTLVAALVPLAIAGATVLGGTGLLDLVARSTAIDAIALSLASMMGLALGVDYSLLIVSRFREELARGLAPRAAASVAAGTAGRTAAFAGAVLFGIMLVALVLSPGRVLLSAAVGTLLVTGLGVVGAVLVTPAGLALLGHRIERGRIGRRAPAGPGRDRLGAVVRASTRRPVLATALVGALLLACAAPVLGLQTVPPDPRALPPGDRAAEGAAEAVALGLGPTVDVTLRVRDGTITRPDRLAAIGRLEDGLRRLRLARVVSGPGGLAGDAAAGGRGVPPDLGRSVRDLARLQRGLRRAASGVSRLREGLAEARGGSGRLHEGSARAEAGTGALGGGTRRAADGASRVAAGARTAQREAGRLVDGLAAARAGAVALAAGARRAERGADELATGAGALAAGLGGELAPALRQLAEGLEGGGSGLGRLREPAQRAEDELRRAFDALRRMSVGRADPRYEDSLVAVGTALGAVSGSDPRDGSPVAGEYRGLPAELGTAAERAAEAGSAARALAAGAERAARGARRARAGARELARGIGRLQDGAGRLRAGVGRLAAGARGGQDGLGQLAAGSARLADGVRELRDGSGRLDRGLAELRRGQAALGRGLQQAVVRTAPLDRGLSGTAGDVARLRGGLDEGAISALTGLQRRSPGFFTSGFAPLAAIDGAPALPRSAATFLVAADRGGDTARILISPALEPNDPRAPAFVEEVRAVLDRVPAELGMRTGIGGPTAALADYDRVTEGRLPLLVLGIAVVTYLLLVPILRSLVLPAIAVALNLLTVAAAFGVLTLLFVGEDPPLGGAGALDVISVASIFAIVFALSIDYQVFLLVRMREAYVATQRNDAAIAFGVERTARVVSGAALIMVGVFTAFAVTGFMSLRQFGVGLAFAVAVDATLVRLVLLPALMQVLGLRTWWLPRWLDDRLPALDVEGGDDAGDRLAVARRAADAW